MDRSLLAARIQEILRNRSKPAAPGPVHPGGASPSGSGGAGLQPWSVGDEEAAFAARCAADEAAADAREVLGGETIDGPGGRCLVVERRYAAWHVHGRQAVGRYADAMAGAMHALPWFLRGGAESDVSRLLFFDLETTGLSGGAGTYAFLVGCGYFDGSDFVTRQFFLRGYGEERALLGAVRDFVEAPRPEWDGPGGGRQSSSSPKPGEGGQPCLVTYNGRAFDLPLIEIRYQLHRSASPLASLPHVDMLFPARRLWRHRATRDGSPMPADPDRGAPTASRDPRASCALTALEQDILRLERNDDVPGWEIPARYFAYARTGDARGLVAVMEHNRLDLLSLAAVTSIVLEQVVEQDRLVRDRPGCLALARLLEHLGRGEDAERCYRKAAMPDGPVEGEHDLLARAEALHWLAVSRRRARRFGDAAEAWRSLLQIPGLGADLRREACEALAIHHEHRARDLQAAKAFAMDALECSRGGRYVPDVEHRLDRLARKMGGEARRPGEPGRHPAVWPADE